MKLSVALAGLVSLLPSALAVSEWGQCGVSDPVRTM